mgnify:CR=1 FL=1
MKKEDLANAVEKLEAAVDAIGMTEHEDTRIMPIYIEYWVANKIADKTEHETEIVNRRGYDILLSEKNIKIEVKSGKYNGFVAGASFGMGSQIRDRKFDFCIFVTYDIDLSPKEAMIFKREELEEVASKPRPEVTRYPKTNACVLFRYDTLEDYVRTIDEKNQLEIEIDLHKHPEKFVNRWDKIS